MVGLKARRVSRALQEGASQPGKVWGTSGLDRSKGPEVGRSQPVLRTEGRLAWLA